jgi:molybdate transport system substrate-binding protein
VRKLAGIAAVALLLSSLASCSGDKGKTKLTVFMASSLTGTFTTLESRFEKSHPDVDVVLSPGSSTTLAEQITRSRAPADVIATADQASISIVERAGDTAAAPVKFATNTLVIAVPPDNPGHVTGVASLNDASFVMCDTSAPCGAAAQQMLQNAGIHAQPKSFELDVASTLAKVETGDVDAGIVYVTDAKGAGGTVTAIAIPASDNVVNPYFIAAVKGSKESSLAQDWIDLVRSAAGQRVLQKAGFGKP